MVCEAGVFGCGNCGEIDECGKVLLKYFRVITAEVSGGGNMIDRLQDAVEIASNYHSIGRGGR